ncbi:uncharacterized protein ACJ7VT_015526 [Polymixia lowei]
MVSSPGRRRWGLCAPNPKSLSSHHTWNPLILALCLVLLVIYGLADKLRNFVADIFIPQYHYPYAVALCFAQVLVSLGILNLLHVLGLVPLRPYSKSLGERLLVPSICDGIQAVLALWAKANNSFTGLFPTVTCLLPLLTEGWSHGLKLEVPYSIHVTVLVAILSGVSLVITASSSVAGTEPLECVYAPLSLILHSLSLTWLAKVFEDERRRLPDAHASIFDVYYAQLVNQSWVLGLLCLLHPDGPRKVLSQGSWHSLLFHGYLLAILLLGVVLNFLLGATALRLSPLAAALLHSGWKLTQPFLKLL